MLGDEMRRLAEEIAGAYEGRQQFLSDLKVETAGLKKQTADFLKDIHHKQDDMSRKLKSELSDFTAGLIRFREDLEHEAAERRAGLRAELKEQAQTLRSNLEQFRQDLNRRSRDRMEQNRRALKETANHLRTQLDDFTAGLAAFTSGLQDAEARRKEQATDEADRRLSEKGDRTAEVDRLRQDSRELLDRFSRRHREMAAALGSSLSGFTDGLSDRVSDFLGELKQSRTEAARVWKELLDSMEPRPEPVAKTAPEPAPSIETQPAPEPEKRASLVEETVEPEESQMEAEEEPEIEVPEEDDMEEGLESEVLDALEENPQGLRMVEIADLIGVDNWRSLIPVMRELIDEGEIRKEDSTYFAL